ncbi:hypothetical protein [Capnocytophaga catalasegens]|uniref:Uncharacterized protein n=1 Tax=Capnocytophaga catalasegens TaxID=1004260 RepID=A0AAV5AZR1_9FLAO|nr:hypothetical protein [Capnocytophaga catalasegens]GIZ14363.1 hypothetical protein RCZ03_03640 [Capnocytophaga catalasegens]GJM51278.1 hypothetical protein RCZ15_22510 [Capnocytophaga catalasegens]GJM53305.1 hypothetical protein RCZ16_16220 [Capnocytophaga catalasegens]
MYQKIKKVFLLALFLVAIPMSARKANGQELQSVKVQLNLKNVTILQIFKSIESQTNFTFVYGSELKK